MKQILCIIGAILALSLSSCLDCSHCPNDCDEANPRKVEDIINTTEPESSETEEEEVTINCDYCNCDDEGNKDACMTSCLNNGANTNHPCYEEPCSENGEPEGPDGGTEETEEVEPDVGGCGPFSNCNEEVVVTSVTYKKKTKDGKTILITTEPEGPDGGTEETEDVEPDPGGCGDLFECDEEVEVSSVTYKKKENGKILVVKAEVLDRFPKSALKKVRADQLKLKRKISVTYFDKEKKMYFTLIPRPDGKVLCFGYKTKDALRKMGGFTIRNFKRKSPKNYFEKN